ncbi:long-chain fatty acid--CoA ligase, partial [Actinomyces sp. S6-Spd3]
MVVPIYETSSVDQIKYILEDADVKMVVTETMVMAQLVQAARVTLERSVQVLSLDNSAIMRITEAGAEVDEAEVDARITDLNIHKPASIVYTSGTTGKPKGTVLTHGNFVTLCKNGHKWMPEIAYRRSSRLLLFLPLAHVYARMLEVFQITGHGIMAHTPNTRNLLSDLESFRPTYLLAVPRVLEKIYNSADAAAGSGVALKTFRWAVKTAIQYSKALDTTLGPSRTLSAQHQMA